MSDHRVKYPPMEGPLWRWAAAYSVAFFTFVAILCCAGLVSAIMSLPPSHTYVQLMSLLILGAGSVMAIVALPIIGVWIVAPLFISKDRP